MHELFYYLKINYSALITLEQTSVMANLFVRRSFITVLNINFLLLIYPQVKRLTNLTGYPQKLFQYRYTTPY